MSQNNGAMFPLGSRLVEMLVGNGKDADFAKGVLGAATVAGAGLVAANVATSVVSYTAGAAAGNVLGVSVAPLANLAVAAGVGEQLGRR